MIKNVISRISRYNRKNIKKDWNKSFEEATRFFFKRKELLLIIVDCYK